MKNDLSNIECLPRCNLTPSTPQLPPTFSPPECWEKSFLQARRDAPLTYLPETLRPNFIEETKPLVEAPERIAGNGEWYVLRTYADLLRPYFGGEAEKEERVDKIFERVAQPALNKLRCLDAHFGPIVADNLKQILEFVQSDTVPIITQQKLVFNRARPYQFSGNLPPPLFEIEHPSYPSGHTTTGFSIAFVICSMLDSAKDKNGKLGTIRVDALAAAHRVAINREIAGVHFPSDTAAGIQLARQIVDEATPIIQKDKHYKLFSEALPSLLA